MLEPHETSRERKKTVNGGSQQQAGSAPSDLVERLESADRRGAEWAEFQRLMNWCADMEMHINPKLTLWTDEWLRINFGEGVTNDDILELSADQIRRLICVAFAKGKFSGGGAGGEIRARRHERQGAERHAHPRGGRPKTMKTLCAPEP